MLFSIKGSSQDGEESSSKGPVEAKAPLGKVVSKEENQDAEETAKEKSEAIEKLQVDKLVDDTIEKQGRMVYLEFAGIYNSRTRVI